MSFEPVDVFVETPLHDPVEGVVVKVYDSTGTTFFTQAITDPQGRASFLLETLMYSMRFYRFQVGFTQPQMFTVLAAPNVNVFDVQAEPFDMPIATDPRLCRCGGFFRDVSGAPKQYLDIHFIAEFAPLLLDSAAVVTEEQSIRTDSRGYAQIDLIRCGQYNAMMEATGSDKLRCINVPDLASANLPDLLFPRVDRVIWDIDAPYSTGVGSTIVLTPTVYDSAGKPLTGIAASDVSWKSSDPSIASLEFTPTTIIIRGNAVGTTQLTATRLDSTIIKIPNTPILGVPLNITVL